MWRVGVRRLCPSLSRRIKVQRCVAETYRATSATACRWLSSTPDSRNDDEDIAKTNEADPPGLLFKSDLKIQIGAVSTVSCITLAGSVILVTGVGMPTPAAEVQSSFAN